LEKKFESLRNDRRAGVRSGWTLRPCHKVSRDSWLMRSGTRCLVPGSWDGTIKFWDVTSGRELRILRGHMGSVTSVAFSPDGRILASGSGDHTIKLWDVASGSELRTLSGNRGFVASVSFSPDGHTLASGGRLTPSGSGMWRAGANSPRRVRGVHNWVGSSPSRLTGRCWPRAARTERRGRGTVRPAKSVLRWSPSTTDRFSP